MSLNLYRVEKRGATVVATVFPDPVIRSFTCNSYTDITVISVDSVISFDEMALGDDAASIVTTTSDMDDGSFTCMKDDL